MNGFPGVESVWQDVRFAARVLAGDRTYTLTVLLTLAICIGANTAMFTVVRSVIFKPLPYPDADTLVLISNAYGKRGELRAGTSSQEYFDRTATLTAFLRILRVNPSQGRIFSEAEGEPGNGRVLLISDGLWRRKFGQKPVVDRMVRFGEVPHRIVGVLPPGFSFLGANDIEVIVPRALGPADRTDRPAAFPDARALAARRVAERRAVPDRRAQRSNDRPDAPRAPTSGISCRAAMKSALTRPSWPSCWPSRWDSACCSDWCPRCGCEASISKPSCAATGAAARRNGGRS